MFLLWDAQFGIAETDWAVLRSLLSAQHTLSEDLLCHGIHSLESQGQTALYTILAVFMTWLIQALMAPVSLSSLLNKPSGKETQHETSLEFGE